MMTGAVGIDSFIRCARYASVFEQRFVLAEDQIQKRLFEVDAAGFAQNVEVFVVFVHLPVGNRQAIGTAGEPGLRQRPRLQPRAIVLRSQLRMPRKSRKLQRVFIGCLLRVSSLSASPAIQAGTESRAFRAAPG